VNTRLIKSGYDNDTRISVFFPRAAGRSH